LRKLSVPLLPVIALTLTNVLSAQSPADALRACTEIYKNSTYNYSDTQQKNIELARSFNSFCKKDGSVSTSATSVGLSAIIYSIPFSFSYGSNTDSQRMEEFCKQGSTQYDSWSANSQNDSTVSVEALANFNSCVALANQGLSFNTSILQPATLVVSGSASATYRNGFLSAIQYDPTTMTCVSADFSRNNVSVPYQGAVHLSTNQPFTITCTKKPQPAADGHSTFYPRATLTISAGGLAPLAIVFPSDTLNGYELASQAKIAVAKAGGDLAIANNNLAASQNLATTLQNRLNGVSVQVTSHLMGDNASFGCWGSFGPRMQQEEAATCNGPGARIVTNSNNGDIHSGGACGYAALAYACLRIPQ
jgi:hypothetical protein